MIYIEDQGRLGNQLLMYTAARVVQSLRPDLMLCKQDYLRIAQRCNLYKFVEPLCGDEKPNNATSFRADMCFSGELARLKQIVIRCVYFTSKNMIDTYRPFYDLRPHYVGPTLQIPQNSCLVHVRAVGAELSPSCGLPIEYYSKAIEQCNCSSIYLTTDHLSLKTCQGLIDKYKPIVLQSGPQDIIGSGPQEIIGNACNFRSIICSGGSFSLWLALQCPGVSFIPSMRIVKSLTCWYDPTWFSCDTLLVKEIDI